MAVPASEGSPAGDPKAKKDGLGLTVPWYQRQPYHLKAGRMSSGVGPAVARVGLPADNLFRVSPLRASFLRTTPSRKVRARAQ